MIDRCICCGAEFIEGKGFVEPHKFPCANERYGWSWTVSDEKQEREAMIDLTKPIRRKSLNPQREGFHVRKITTDATFRIEYEDGTWTMIGSLEELESCYENIPEPRKPREWHIMEVEDGRYVALKHLHIGTRVIEWPTFAPLPDWPEGYK